MPADPGLTSLAGGERLGHSPGFADSCAATAADPCGDVFALGRVLYHAVTGPHPAESYPFIPPQRLREIPAAEFADLLDRCGDPDSKKNASPTPPSLSPSSPRSRPTRHPGRPGVARSPSPCGSPVSEWFPCALYFLGGDGDWRGTYWHPGHGKLRDHDEMTRWYRRITPQWVDSRPPYAKDNDGDGRNELVFWNDFGSTDEFTDERVHLCWTPGFDGNVVSGAAADGHVGKVALEEP